ncbi:MAG: hypothetical protein K2M48_05870, partial [Clostridiales bacterium]|nr:hypothetical protein [Clostridiales bacterium]
MSFVPDSEFPVINSEKGISHIRLDFKDGALAKNISHIDGAACRNAVPDRSTVTVVANSPLYKALGGATADVFKTAPAVERIVTMGARPEDFEIQKNRDGIFIAANGTAEHASTPEKGDSALWKMLGFLAAYNGAI